MGLHKTHLLDLPVEIRKKIWSFVLPPHECTVVLRPGVPLGLSRTDIPPELEVDEDVKLNGQVARVCRRVYEDVQPCLFAGKIFCVGPPKDAYFILLCQVIHHRNRRMLKRMELNFSFSERKDLLVDLKHSVVEVFTQLEELIIRRVCRARESYTFKFTEHIKDIILILENGLPRLKHMFRNKEGVDLRFTMAQDNENDAGWIRVFKPLSRDRLERVPSSR